MNNSENEKAFGLDDLIDEVKTFMIAGSETTSNFITAMILYCFEKPEVIKRLRN